jgi:DNA-binding MarR family transcriptional regulator
MQNDFSSLEKSAWGGMLRVHAEIFQAIELDLKQNFALSHAEFEALLRLSWEADGLCIQDLAARSIMSTSGTSRVIDRLVAQGWVSRAQDKKDRRSARVTLTAGGFSHFNKALDHHVTFVREVFLSHFTEDEQRKMGEFWQRIGVP